MLKERSWSVRNGKSSSSGEQECTLMKIWQFFFKIPFHELRCCSKGPAGLSCDVMWTTWGCLQQVDGCILILLSFFSRATSVFKGNQFGLNCFSVYLFCQVMSSAFFSSFEATEWQVFVCSVYLNRIFCMVPNWHSKCLNLSLKKYFSQAVTNRLQVDCTQATIISHYQ